jgi:hypothetical protein
VTGRIIPFPLGTDDTTRAIAAVGEVISVTHITTRQDMSRWTRAHADAPGINWSVHPGPGGTMLIVEHTHDRATVTRPAATAATPKEAA